MKRCREQLKKATHLGFVHCFVRFFDDHGILAAAAKLIAAWTIIIVLQKLEPHIYYDIKKVDAAKKEVVDLAMILETRDKEHQEQVEHLSGFG